MNTDLSWGAGEEGVGEWASPWGQQLVADQHKVQASLGASAVPASSQTEAAPGVSLAVHRVSGHSS